jgi:hypothetical protein
MDTNTNTNRIMDNCINIDNDEDNEHVEDNEDDETILPYIKTDGNPQSLIIGDVTVPGDIELFNQMWITKAFDAIKPTDRLKINPMSLFGAAFGSGLFQINETPLILLTLLSGDSILRTFFLSLESDGPVGPVGPINPPFPVPPDGPVFAAPVGPPPP